MNTDDLKRFEFSQHDVERGEYSEDFFRCGFEGLMLLGWGWQALALDEVEQGTLSRLLTLWIAHAPVTGEDDAMRLMLVRNGLRRLAFAMGHSLHTLVGIALEIPADASLMDLPVSTRRKLAFLADATLCEQADILAWSRAEPRLAMIWAMTALDDVQLCEPQLRALDRLADLIPSLQLADLPTSVLTLLYRASFRLSYLTSAQRYQGKTHLVKQAGLVLAGAGLNKDVAAPASGRQRPRLVVVGEGLLPGHAMFRFYATMLREMRRHFHLTLLTDVAPAPLPGVSHPVSTPVELADEVVHFAAGEDPLSAWTAQIRALQPDIIFYPSIGMSFATFTLSLLRLAPLQVASTGHPASSCSPVIDATLLFSDLVAPPELPFPLRYDDHRLFPAVTGLDMPARRPEADGAAGPALPCLGVNAVISKLNAGFLATLEQVMREFGKPCRLRFLPNVGGLELQGLKRVLEARFPDVEVVPSLDHKAYLAELAQCDLVLQSFPFGGANTTNDALKLGIPVVALRDITSLAGQTDAVMLNARGLGHLCVDRAEDYVRLALRLLDDEAYAGDLRRGLREAGPGAGQAHKGEVTAADVLLRHWQALAAGYES